MTERDFWAFLNGALEKGRAPQVSGVIDSKDPQLQHIGKAIGGHSFLPKDYDKIPVKKIIEMGKLLTDKKASLVTKEAILVLLAHQPKRKAFEILKDYVKNPDEQLKYFAQFTLDECEMWNE